MRDLKKKFDMNLGPKFRVSTRVYLIDSLGSSFENIGISFGFSNIPEPIDILHHSLKKHLEHVQEMTNE